MLIVGIDEAAVEANLRAGRLGCPSCGSAGLRPWGHGVEREVRLRVGTERRRVRRSVCRPCGGTHVLIPEDTLLRRRDAVEVVGAALTAKARGVGHRSIATGLGRHPSTVRGWLRRFAVMAGELREHFTRWAHALDPGHVRLSPGGSVFTDALEALGVLGIVAVRRFGPRPPWSLASVVAGGGLLCNTSSPRSRTHAQGSCRLRAHRTWRPTNGAGKDEAMGLLEIIHRGFEPRHEQRHQLLTPSL